MQRFSARCSHSSVRSACWLTAGIGEASGFQASKVLPAGNPDARRRMRIVAWSRPAAFSVTRTLRTSPGSQRCEAAVAITSGAARRT